jgi:uncharacterized protein (TIGR03435 family)
MRKVSFGLLAASLAGAAFAQPTPSKPAFDKADIHTAVAIGGMMMGRTGFPYVGKGRYEIRDASLLTLITIAYGIDAEKVVGGPSWLEWDRFDLVAALPRDTPPETQKIMLQTLLADRFKLVLHDDTKDLTGYVLTAGKSPKLKTADGSGDPGCRGQLGGPGITTMPGGGLRINQDAGPITNTFTCRNMTMAAFVTFLRPQVSQNGTGASPVTDQTGLKGVWDFDFKITLQMRLLNAGAAPSEQITIFDAVDKQLGLKLTQTKTPLPVMVVDSAIEKPTPNLPGVAESLVLQVPKEFDVADVKPSDPAGRGGRLQVKPGGGVDFSGLPLQMLISQAYRVQGQQLIVPPNLQEALQKRYDIIAKPPAPDSPADSPSMAGGPPRGPAMPSLNDNEAAWAMMRTLLVDRFKLVVHKEERQLTAYKLIALKPKMKKADPSERTKTAEGPGADGKDPRIATPSRSRLSMFQNVTMKQFAETLSTLSAYVNTPVVDATGLEGTFDFTLNYSPVGAANRNLAGRGGPDGPPGPESANAAAEPDGSITLFDALEQQLGLKLVEEKRAVTVFVIDHVEPKPTDN